MLLPYLVGRLPVSMVLLALLLMVRASERSFGRAGLVSAVYGVGAALSAPLLGRLVDRTGQTRVLVACGLSYAATLSWTVFATAHLSFVLVLAGAALAGVAAPPTSACMRALWPSLVSDDDLRETAYALDALLIEASELAGPLFVAGAVALAGPSVAVLLAAALTSGGALLFALAPPSRAAVPTRRDFHWAGPLRIGGVRSLIAVIFVSTVGIGAFEVAVVGFAAHHGGAAGAGVLLACVTAGSIAGGLFYGGRRWGMPITGQLTVLLTIVAGLSLLPLLATNRVVMSGLLVLTGVAVAPSLVAQLSLMSRLTAPDTRTEAFMWGATANFGGVAIGTAIAGWLVERLGSDAAFVAAAVGAGLAVLVAIATRRSLLPHVPEASPAEQPVAGVELEAPEAPEPAGPDVATEVPAALVLRLPIVLAGGEERNRALRMLRRLDELATATEAACNEERTRSAAAAAARVADAEREAAAMLVRAEIQALRLVAAAEERAADILAEARGDARELTRDGVGETATVYPFPDAG